MTLVIIKDHLASFEIAPGQFAYPNDVIELDEKEAQTQVDAGNVTLVNDNDLDNFTDKVKEPDSLLIEKDNEIASLRKKLIERNEDSKYKSENKALKEEISTMAAEITDLKAQIVELNKPDKKELASSGPGKKGAK